ncbi:MAG: ComEC/Rec2 family competence protein [Planctomycetota bacterium]|jgi:beta-lactamase superfamily II metal-dependent hydrolase
MRKSFNAEFKATTVEKKAAISGEFSLTCISHNLSKIVRAICRGTVLVKGFHPLKAFCFCLIAILVFILSCNSVQKFDFVMHFIDVGYADAIAIQLPNDSTILVDSGDDPNAIELLRYLKSIGIQKIETAIITHPDYNHFNGFKKLIDELPIQKFYTNGEYTDKDGYNDLIDRIRDLHIPIEVLRSGDYIKDLPETITIDILNPFDLSASRNGNSIVHHIKYKDAAILLTADIEPEIQDTLIKNYPEIKNASIVQVPHHGGPVSDLFKATFINKFFIVSTSMQTESDTSFLNDLENLQGYINRTDKSGSIKIMTDGKEVFIR